VCWQDACAKDYEAIAHGVAGTVGTRSNLSLLLALALALV
jgi:hypothetical protein